MNTKLKTLIGILTLLVVVTGCVTLESLSLDDAASSYAREQGSVLLFGKSKATLTSWFACVKERPSLSMDGTNLKASFKEAKGDCFGIYFNIRDISKTPVIKVRAKFTSSSAAPSMDMLAGFTDDKDGKTYNPEKGKLVKSGSNYTDYYFDYSDVVNVNDGSIDPAKVKTVLIFVNILGAENVSGDLLIEEVSLLSKQSKTN